MVKSKICLNERTPIEWANGMTQNLTWLARSISRVIIVASRRASIAIVFALRCNEDLDHEETFSMPETTI
jgi:hypothetical protein